MRKLERAGRNRFLEKAKTFIAAVPLAAVLMTGCTDPRDECRIHNDSTVTINSETDGKSPGVSELERIGNGSYLVAPQIDFINETHALSSEGMPADVRVTHVEASCSTTDNPGKTATGYTQPVSADGLQRGIYIPDNPQLDPISLINLMNHEIGHLQPGNPPKGFEVVSQLNEYEQQLMGFALLGSQGDSGDLTRWQSHMVHPGIFRRLVQTLESGRGTESDPFDVYDRANMFIFEKLVELNGDFKALRGQIGQLVQNEGHGGALMDAALDDAVSRFQSGFTTNADMFISFRMRMLSELERRFGLGAAYLDANSKILDAALVYGLDGLDCAYNSKPADAYEACADAACTGIGANSQQSVAYSLCCLGMDGSGFSKWSVIANGTRYRNDQGKISMDGFDWDTVSYLTPTKTSLGIDESCGKI